MSIDLAEFVHDYLQIEDAQNDSNEDIANAYLETIGTSAPVTPELVAQIAYYR